MAAAVAQIESDRRRLRSRSSEYNCVGLVFASRRTWVDTDEVARILVEDGYTRIPLFEAEPGDVVVYRDSHGELVHVAVLHSREPNLERATVALNVLSQWGSDGEYFHEAGDVFERLGQPTEAWTDRL